MATTADLLTIYKKCSELGATPDDNDADSICTAIQKIYDDQYSSGTTYGKANCSHKGSYSVSCYGYFNSTTSLRYGCTVTSPSGTRLCTITVSKSDNGDTSSSSFTLS